MNLKSRTFLTKFCGCGLAVASAMAAKHVLAGQAVLMGPPPTTLQSAAELDDSTNNEMNVFLPTNVNRDNALPEPFQYGPVVFRPHPYYHFQYASGIQSGTNNSQSSIIQEFAPGIAVDLGRHWVVDYTPTIRFYSNRAFRNSIDHAATLTGGTAYEDWAFNLSQSFVKSDSTLVDTATQTRTEAYDTELGAERVLNDKMFAQFGVSQVFNFVSGLQNSRTWSTMDWLNYVYASRLNFGLGAGGGYTMISSDSSANSNPNQSFEQLQARVQWRATDKVFFGVNAGLEERQNLAAGYKDELNPTFGASIDYAPFTHTDITLAAGRTVGSSDYSIIAQSTETTTVSLSVNQRLLEDYNLSMGVGYTQTEYTIALGGLSGFRTDDNYNFNVRLGRSFLKRGNVAVTYQYSKNSSNVSGFSYNSSQIGFEVGYSY
ncbi:MAG: outer membrane beta-barrel protein [Verrucomicrobiae bacterium]|nr:outer membrane beta-barrel protein [Verrucomicrobiae bacterium]